MKKIIPVPILLVAVFLIQSCGSTQKTTIAPVARIVEKERIINKPFDDIWQNTIELLATYNMPIKNLDKSSGFISTEYKPITGQVSQYTYCYGANSTFTGKIEMSNHGGNLNVLLKKIDSNSTKVTVNCFYSCTENKYKYKSLLSTDYVLMSSTRKECESTGNLEKAILDNIGSK